MLSRTRTFGRITPISAARFCRTRWMRSSRSPPRLRIGQPNQTHAEFQFHRINRQVVLDAMLGLFGGFGLFSWPGNRLGLALAAREASRPCPHAAAPISKQRNPRQTGEDQDAEKSARHGQRLWPREELPQKLPAAGCSPGCCGLPACPPPAKSETREPA